MNGIVVDGEGVTVLCGFVLMFVCLSFSLPLYYSVSNIIYMLYSLTTAFLFQN